MCAEFPETHFRLEQWADYYNDRDDFNKLGYSYCSSHLKSAGGGGSTQSHDNPEVEEIERLMTALCNGNAIHKIFYKVLRSKYLYRDSNAKGCKKIHLSKTKYNDLLGKAIVCIDTGLNKIS